MMSYFQFGVRPDSPANARVYECFGVVDSSKSIEELCRHMRGERVAYLVLNFERVSYVNSTGYGTIVELIVELQEKGKVVYITNPSPRVKIVFEQLGGDSLPILSLQEAFERIRQSRDLPAPPKGP